MLKRIIPTLLVQNRELIKTINFSNPTYIGDLLNSVKIYNELQVDELCVLDKSARKNGINFEMIREFANEAFSPVSYGGGINQLDQIEKLLRIGIEKIVLSTAALDYNFVKEAVNTFGSSTITVCIDYKLVKDKELVLVENGTKNTDLEVDTHLSNLNELRVGEVILQSIERDGTYSGYDLKLLKRISEKVNNPIVISGGCSSLLNMKQAFDDNASGVAAGSLFVYYTNKKGILINYPTQEELLTQEIER